LNVPVDMPANPHQVMGMLGAGATKINDQVAPLAPMVPMLRAMAAQAQLAGDHNTFAVMKGKADMIEGSLQLASQVNTSIHGIMTGQIPQSHVPATLQALWTHFAGQVIYSEIAPDAAERGPRMVEWFNNDELSDVVVLQEIWSDHGADVLRGLCNDDWTRIGAEAGGTYSHDEKFTNKVIHCRDDSKFSMATSIVGPSTADQYSPNHKLGFQISGGVVILVSKGVEITEAHDEIFTDREGEDAIANRGFWSVKVVKDEQSYRVLGTHASPYEGKREERQLQFQQMRRHMDSLTESRVVVTGDLNIFIDELDQTRQTLQGEDAVCTIGTNTNSPFTHDIIDNYYVSKYPEEVALGNQQFDLVFACESDGNSPSVQYSTVKVRSQVPFQSSLGDVTSELSDHFAVKSAITWG